MKKFLIYSSNICPYCLSAKSLLENLELSFQEKIIDNSDEIKRKCMKDQMEKNSSTNLLRRISYRWL